MTYTEFTQAWNCRYTERGTLEGEQLLFSGENSLYVRCRCPYCAKKTKLGPDTGFHLHAHFEKEWFKCQRCGTRGRMGYLLGIYQPKPVDKDWTTFVCEPDAQPRTEIIRARGFNGQLMSPGQCTPLAKVPKDHPAWQYLESEGFERRQLINLAEVYGIYVCFSGKQLTSNVKNTTTGRLVFEIREGTKLIGWQARWLPKNWPPSPEDLQEAEEVSKYLLCPGVRKTHALYNWTIAQNWDMWVVVEGVKKVWKTGAFALCTFGIGNQVNPPEGVSQTDHDRFWSVRLLNGRRPVILLYDKGAEEAAADHARDLTALGVDVRVATLPEHGADDLDDYMTTEIRSIIKQTAGRLPRQINSNTTNPATWMPDTKSS